MVKATLNGVVIAETDQPTTLEGNYYFPPDSVKQEVLVNSPTQYVTLCRLPEICTQISSRL